MEPPWRAHHLPHPHSSGLQLCANQVVGVTGFCLEERWILHAFVRMIGASFTNYLARSNTILICKKLEGEKVTKAQEWGIECVNVQWLSELVLGNLRALKLPIDRKYKVFNKPDDFAIDQSMAASVMSGWRVPLKIPKDNCRKFKPSSKSTEAGWDNKRKADGDTFTHPNKRIKLQEIQNTSSNLPKGHRPHVVLTGYTVREKEKYSDIVRSLGGVVCEDVRKCTHLIAEKVLRTPNFLLAMNYCSYISSSEWITESMKSGHFVDERVFTLQNSDAGSMWNILEALERRNNQGKPFADLQFHLTPGVSLSTSLSRNFLSELITAAGGSIQSPDEKRWSVRKILENVKNSQVCTHCLSFVVLNGKPTYIVISCKDDVHICMDILRANQDVYSVEFILSGVMNQVAPYDAVLCVKETKQAN
ncbi:PAXIP1 [Bugula neritina]|uniref:PAX-interacting protein 1 n=1 Tax=Bugula neritina TaxID=10212 RepID=A0A7J7JZR6_BUGNE|nr:PAXIP1 [Bugula neritina]